MGWRHEWGRTAKEKKIKTRGQQNDRDEALASEFEHDETVNIQSAVCGNSFKPGIMILVFL